MLAEAPRNSGTGEPIHPQKTDGGFLRFLRGIFTELPTESQSGLEDFANQLQREIDNSLALQKQQELERKNAEFSEKTAAARHEAEIAEQIRVQEEQERLRKEAAFAEAMAVLKEYQIEAKLAHIQRTVWGDKGIVKTIGPELEIAYRVTGVPDRYRLGGLQLIHKYPFFNRTVWEDSNPLIDGSVWTEWRYDPRTIFRGISVVVFREADKKILNIRSEAETCDADYEAIHRARYLGDVYDFFVKDTSFITKVVTITNVDVPVAASESQALIDSVLIKDSTERITHGLLPAELENEASARLAIAKRNPRWMRTQS